VHATGARSPLSLLQRGRPGAAPGAPDADADVRAGEPGGAVLICAACGLPITDAGARIEVGGAHRHTRTNSGGFTHTFGCFAYATGCLAVGEPEFEDTWFAGHSWQVQDCARCRTHLGWLWRGEARRFWGLIVERVVEQQPGA